LNFEVIAVLNGSISRVAPEGSTWVSTSSSTAAAAIYLPSHKRFSSAGRRVPLRHAQRTGYLASNSCSAPNGHSQPQNTPRPIKHHRDQRVGGDDDHQRLGEVEADIEVIERRHSVVHHIDDRELHAGGPAEPDQDNEQKAVATSRWARRWRASLAWNTKIRVSTTAAGQDRNIDLGIVPGLTHAATGGGPRSKGICRSLSLASASAA